MITAAFRELPLLYLYPLPPPLTQAVGQLGKGYLIHKELNSVNIFNELGNNYFSRSFT